jgi:ADP-heptose:LPS heptosyltransferase
LQQADLAIGADSGPAHLAAAAGTPVVVLFSGTNRVEQWRPQGAMVQALRHPVACAPCHRRQCPVASQPCMRGIRPADVLLAIEELLAAAAGRGEDRSALVPAKRGAEQ